MPKVLRAPKRNVPLERDIQADIRAYLASQPDVTIFRNAQVYVTFDDGHKARTGLGNGSADLIGSLTYETPWWPIGIFARALGIEIKRPGERLRKEQRLWHDEMRKRGWIVGVATSVVEATDIVERARRWEI